MKAKPILIQPCDASERSALTDRSGYARPPGRPGRPYAGGLLGLMLGLSNVATAGDADALANERIPVNRLRMEAQWGVDCDAALHQVRERGSAGLPEEDTAGLADSLTLCGFIYNTPGTQTYRVCPDFGHWRDWMDGRRG